MGPLHAYNNLPLPNILKEVTLTEQQFGERLLVDSFINLPFPTSLKITEANKTLCAKGRIATALKGSLQPIITELFGSAIHPFRTKFKLQLKSPITVTFGSDESSYALTTQKGVCLRRGYLSLPISLAEIRKIIHKGHTPQFPRLYTEQILWFRDLQHELIMDFDGLDEEEIRVKFIQILNSLIPSSHRFILEYVEDETDIIPKMTGDSNDGIIVKSERLMSIKIVPSNASANETT